MPTGQSAVRRLLQLLGRPEAPERLSLADWDGVIRLGRSGGQVRVRDDDDAHRELVPRAASRVQGRRAHARAPSDGRQYRQACVIVLCRNQQRFAQPCRRGACIETDGDGPLLLYVSARPKVTTFCTGPMPGRQMKPFPGFLVRRMASARASLGSECLRTLSINHRLMRAPSGRRARLSDAALAGDREGVRRSARMGDDV